MQIIKGKKELAGAIAGLRAAGRLALVPTMGALHDGHLALVREARRRADSVLASIFVNPLQFNDAGDLDRYPRDEAGDAAKLEAAGCEAVWLPTPGDLYPPGFATSVHVAGITERWEGAHRPGHFDGVATVVTKLFTNVRPDIALFGEKDWQQLALIRRMTRDLDLGVEIVGLPTVRDADGLALSSRNALLSPAERAVAPTLNRTLDAMRTAIREGQSVAAAEQAARDALAAAGFGPIDYVAHVDADSLEPLAQAGDNSRIIAAATLGKVRLIDNRAG
ncbi:pantoate--beta-alanine ligase [Sphingomicrobium astaxanthinifaciens]|uniref:pantoate--beta-alanine ligase n=1 Tax=Sphingomicrobium astaxanthinifaciens TaxID=1227949 RepID=UPI001FCB9230|nr:pantoate--beta-alanine ligase [Sphingomicrobium astaxanthinifaciens]MCJ7420901.1 pantoate--beta-alanine ligase [Sphingomicrobium astaxanthinifaciens]